MRTKIPAQSKETHNFISQNNASEPQSNGACNSHSHLSVTVNHAVIITVYSSKAQPASSSSSSYRLLKRTHAITNSHFRSLFGKTFAMILAHMRSLDTPSKTKVSKLGSLATHSGSRLG